MTTEPSSPDSSANGRSDGGLVAILLLAVWIGGTAFVIYPVVWLAEQLALSGGREIGRSIWVAAVAAHALAVILPSLAALALVRAPGYRVVFRMWALAGLFALIAIAVQLVVPSAAQKAAIAQIACAGLFLLVLVLLRRRAGGRSPLARGPLWPSLLAAGLIGWPWVVWGALGSWLDTALNLAAALLFGLAAGWLLVEHLSAQPAENGANDRPLPYLLSGLAAGAALLTMGAAFGYNGQQLILLFLLSGLGWLAVAVVRWGKGFAPGNGMDLALLIGLVVAGPLLFVDPDELTLLLNFDTRDVGYYAFLATLIGLGTALLLSLIYWPLSRRVDESRRSLPWLVTAAVWIGLVILYPLVGQPGWNGDRLYVILADQADLSAAADIADPIERRTFVYQALIGQADTTQSGIRRALDTGGIDYTPYYLDNALEVDAGPLVRVWLEARPEVGRVLDSPELRPLPEPPGTSLGSAGAPSEPQWNLVNIGAPRVWEEFGVRGAGIVIGQSDSGVDGTHPELTYQYRGNHSSGPEGNDYNWLDPWYATPSPVDRGGHGTHTLGTALGRSVGVAPEATWIACVNLARNLGNPPRYLDCLQFLLAPFPQGGDPFLDGRPELGANVLNNSWGCPEIEGCDPNALLPAVRALRAAGVFVVASAGNEGSVCGSVAAPISLYDEVFSVGAIDEFGDVAPFSSRGPVMADGSGRVKPDVVAPGVDVLSSFPGGTYGYNDGTSMAGPHVAGVVALLWSANPALIGDIDHTEQILTETAQPIADEQSQVDACGDPDERPNNTVGFGLVDAYAAVARALADGN